MQALVAHLHGHHQIEDFHYFPSFKAAEPRLAAGFDTLEKDHETLHAGIMQVFDTIDAFMTTVRDPANQGAERHAGDRFVEASLALCLRLARHLDDEEDLIIPLMLDR